MDDASLQSHRSKNKRNLLRKFVGFCMVHIFGATGSKGLPKKSCHSYVSCRSVDHWRFPVVGRRRRSYRAASLRITARRFSRIWTAIFWMPRRTRGRVRVRRSAPVLAVGPPERPTVWCRAIRRRRPSPLWRRPRPRRRRRRVTPAVSPVANVYRRCRRNRPSEESLRDHDWALTAALWMFFRKRTRCRTATKPVTRKPAIYWWGTPFRTRWSPIRMYRRISTACWTRTTAARRRRFVKPHGISPCNNRQYSNNTSSSSSIIIKSTPNCFRLDNVSLSLPRIGCGETRLLRSFPKRVMRCQVMGLFKIWMTSIEDRWNDNEASESEFTFLVIFSCDRRIYFRKYLHKTSFSRESTQIQRINIEL